MALPDVNPGQEASAVHYRKLLYLLSGKVGDHQQQVALTGFDDDDDYAFVVRNRGTDGLGVEVQNSSGVPVFRVNDDEVSTVNLHLPHQAAPSTVAAGRVALYAKSDNLLYFKTPAGTETVVNGIAYGQNYLVNPGFEVWSRGAGPFTTNGDWTADKWNLAEGAAATTSISRTAATDPGSEYALAWSQSATGATSSLTQVMEYPATFRGKTVTFSVRAKTAYAGAIRLTLTDGVSSTSSSFHTGGNSYETLSATITASASAALLFCIVSFVVQGQATSGEVDNAVLSISASAIAYEPLPTAEDQARCRRFYQVREVLQTGRSYDTTNTILSASTALSPLLSNQTTPTVTSSLDVLNQAGTTASFTHTATTVSATGDSYGYHTLKTTWTKAGDIQNARLAGTVVVETRA